MRRLWLGFGWLILSAACLAAGRNDIPNCYQFNHLQQVEPKTPGRELVIMIDQTVDVPLAIRQNVWQRVLQWAKPGDHIILYQFSALLQDKYLNRAFDGQLNPLLTDKAVRDNLGMDNLKGLDQCLIQQQRYFANIIGKVMAKSYAAAGDNLARSEIIGSLRAVNQELIHDSTATDRRFLIVSDMLENSDFDSFYSHNAIRPLDVKAELKKLAQQDLLTNFSGAKVYIVGAGLVPQHSSNNYRSGKVMQQLQAFWQQWVSDSKGQLVNFGAPEMNINLQ